MKWSNEKIEQLKTLCSKGQSNKAIAEFLEVPITEVYAKRSQLGITIDKCNVPAKPKRGLRSDVAEALKHLQNEILVAMAYNGTSIRDAEEYSKLSENISGAVANFIIKINKEEKQ